MTQTQQQVGLVGLAVMGENLALNIAEKGFTIAVYNRSTERVDAFAPSSGVAFALDGRDWLGKTATSRETFGQAKRRYCETIGTDAVACRPD